MWVYIFLAVKQSEGVKDNNLHIRLKVVYKSGPKY